VSTPTTTSVRVSAMLATVDLLYRSTVCAATWREDRTVMGSGVIRLL